MKDRENVKRIMVYSAAIIYLIVTACFFAVLWYGHYQEQIPMPFWRKGNWLVIALYMVIVFIFTRIYGGLRIGYLKIADTIYALVLSMLFANAITYLQICLIGRKMLSIVPFLILCAADLIVIIVWAVLTNLWYLKLYPPHKILVIYGEHKPDLFMEKLRIRKDKYNVCGMLHINQGLDYIKKAIMAYEAVVIWDLPAHERNALLKFCFAKSVRCYITPKISDIIITGADRIHLFDTPLLLSRNSGLTWEQKVIKRLIDIIGAAIGLIFFSPLMLIIAVLIKIHDAGPVFYRQERVSISGKAFFILKFRSMHVNSEGHGAVLAKKQDERVTPLGYWLRNLHFDELPQLFNILKGDMSIVGPRPERKSIMREYKKSIPEFSYRLKVKAGLTGYAQVYGKYNTTPYDKLKLDLFYIENYSLLLDFKLLLMTLRILFQKETSEGVETWQDNALQQDDIQKDDRIKEDIY